MTGFSKATPYAHDDRWTENELRQTVAIWQEIKNGPSLFLEHFVGHPDEQLAKNVVAEAMAPKPVKPREVRFTPPADRYDRWQKAADAMGLPLTIWVQLAADGLLPRCAPVETATAAVPETTMEPPPIWRRVLADMDDRNTNVISKRALAEMAGRLGLEPSRLVASLGSMVTYGTLENKGTYFKLI